MSARVGLAWNMRELKKVCNGCCYVAGCCSYSEMHRPGIKVQTTKFYACSKLWPLRSKTCLQPYEALRRFRSTSGNWKIMFRTIREYTF